VPKSIWNGTIAFGAVAVPIKLYSATESKTVHFHELHRRDEAREEVDYDEVVKGYEVSEGEYVVLTKEEVAAADPSRGKVIELEDFVATGEIDPVYYDRTYYDDRHRARLRKIIRDKKKGRKVKLAEPKEAPESVPDLMTALEESLKRAKAAA
jgi:non-homologous end joining protein Ku